MELTGIAWQLIAYGPVNEPISAASIPATITFSNDGQVNGSGGCNGFTGSYEVSADQISFGQLGSTLQACVDDAITQQESTVFGALVGDVHYGLSDDTLRMPYGDNNALVFASDTASGTVATATSNSTISGTVTYLQRIALLPDATLTVQLLDTSRADAPSITLAEQTIMSPGQVPIAFEVPYDPTQIDSRGTYTVRAEIRSDEQLWWTTTTAYQVITNGNPTSVEIVLDQVSR